jgi:hypothetical protein
VPALVIVAPGAGVSRIGFHRLAILAFPLTLAALQAGNVGHPRYYLLAGVSLLLLVAELLWLELARPGWKRWAAALALAAISAASLALDIDLAINRRGDPGAAIRAMQARAPGGTRMILDRSTGLAMLQVAAAEAGYKLDIATADCPPGRFLFVDRFKGEKDAARLERCGLRFVPILTTRAHGMSGTHWTLYERQP